MTLSSVPTPKQVAARARERRQSLADSHVPTVTEVVYSTKTGDAPKSDDMNNK